MSAVTLDKMVGPMKLPCSNPGTYSSFTIKNLNKLNRFDPLNALTKELIVNDTRLSANEILTADKCNSQIKHWDRFLFNHW